MQERAELAHGQTPPIQYGPTPELVVGQGIALAEQQLGQEKAMVRSYVPLQGTF